MGYLHAVRVRGCSGLSRVGANQGAPGLKPWGTGVEETFASESTLHVAAKRRVSKSGLRRGLEGPSGPPGPDPAMPFLGTSQKPEDIGKLSDVHPPRQHLHFFLVCTGSINGQHSILAMVARCERAPQKVVRWTAKGGSSSQINSGAIDSRVDWVVRFLNSLSGSFGFHSLSGSFGPQLMVRRGFRRV